ncbi:MAG: M3 family metallopeptidase [Wenzhouxiangellaceae bacterium]
MHKRALVIALMATLAACGEAPDSTSSEEPVAMSETQTESHNDNAAADAAAVEPATDNPLLETWDTPYGVPPFDRIDNDHYQPALEQAMAIHRQEMDAIAAQDDAPTFANTIEAMERSGLLLDQVTRVFFSLAGANTNDTLQSVQREIAPKLSAHRDAILLNGDLFSRVDTLYQQRDDLGLDAESLRLLERYHLDFVRAGAKLSESDKDRLREINTELAALGTEFSQNVLKEVNDSAVVVDDEAQLAGLSANSIKGMADAAAERDMAGKYLIALQNTSGQPPLDALENRDLRLRIMEASLARGSRGNEFDNREIVSKVMKLRAERARMLGYNTHAAYILDDSTAKTVEAVNEMLGNLAPVAVANARREAADMQAVIDEEGGDFEVAAADWAFYAEKVRQARYAFDADDVRPYFELNNVLEKGVFHAANRLFGISFKERTDIPVYHPDVRVFEVFDADGSPLSLFLADFYARSSKRGGAWMNSYAMSTGLLGGEKVIANHLNIPKPPAGEPTLMTFDEVTTMFHEFGHALHGMFSDVHYPRFAGTSVPRDFVEYPSQVNEMWATWPEILKNYAVHYQTGEPIPQELLDKVLEAQKFNQGHATTEYLAASMLDQAWHQLSADQVPSADGVLDFEAQALAAAGINFDPVPPRYRTTYFSHIMGGYSAGYYSYIWSEVLDADSVEWFKENGGLLRENGDHFRKTLLSRGGSKEAMDLFRDFRGRDPQIEPLLERRGLTSN